MQPVAGPRVVPQLVFQDFASRHGAQSRHQLLFHKLTHRFGVHAAITQRTRRLDDILLARSFNSKPVRRFEGLKVRLRLPKLNCVLSIIDNDKRISPVHTRALVGAEFLHFRPESPLAQRRATTLSEMWTPSSQQSWVNRYLPLFLAKPNIRAGGAAAPSLE